MLHINIICIGKIKEDFLKNALKEYSKRLSKYCVLNTIELSDEKIPNSINEKIIRQIKNSEGEKIISNIKDSYVFSLDLNGKQFSSEDFSNKISNLSFKHSKITFVIGGTLGLSDDVLAKSDELICFSKMTFPHQLIRVFLLEQLFRGFKIINNETYHR